MAVSDQEPSQPRRPLVPCTGVYGPSNNGLPSRADPRVVHDQTTKRQPPKPDGRNQMQGPTSPHVRLPASHLVYHVQPARRLVVHHLPLALAADAELSALPLVYAAETSKSCKAVSCRSWTTAPDSYRPPGEPSTTSLSSTATRWAQHHSPVCAWGTLHQTEIDSALGGAHGSTSSHMAWRTRVWSLARHSRALDTNGIIISMCDS